MLKFDHTRLKEYYTCVVFSFTWSSLVACNNSGHDVVCDFAEVSKIVEAANLFRISHTEEKLKRDEIDNAYDAMATHITVGREVRAAIDRVGGTMPEDLPTPEKRIAQAEKEQIAKLKTASQGKTLDVGRAVATQIKITSREDTPCPH